MHSPHRLKIVGCLLVSAFGLSIVSTASAAELKRRGMVGVQLAPVPPSEGSTEPGAGALIQGIVPGGAAEAAGLKANDVIIKIGDSEVANLPGFMTAVRAFGAGDKAPFTVRRGEETLTVDVALADRPRETSDKYEVVYDSVDVSGVRLRSYITRPKGDKKLPALLILPSPSPQPMEMLPQMADHPYKKLVDALTLAGFVTMRIDRYGVGDSEGGDPTKTTIQMDADAYRAAARQLSKLSYVDSNRVFILSQGMGSAVAPFAAKDSGVRGIALYGATIFRPAQSGMSEAVRRMLLLNDPEDKRIDKTTSQLEQFFTLVADGAKPSEAFAKIEGLAEALESVGGTQGGDAYVMGVPYDYFMQMEKTDYAKAWAGVGAKVLVLWGEADYQANRKDSELIAASINKSKPGTAEFRALPGIDHVGNLATDQEDSFLSGYSASDMNPILVKTLSEWVEKTGNGNA